MRRVLGCFAPLWVAAAFLAGCSSNGLGVTLSGDTHQAIASGVSCDPGSASVTVSGSLMAPPGSFSNGRVATIVMPNGQRVRIRPPKSASLAPSATVYDSAGHQIGAFDGPDVTVREDKATFFKFVVPLEGGTPAACALSWTGGSAPVLGE